MPTVQLKTPSQLNNEEAVALLPQQQVITVVQRHVVPGKPDVEHRWHREFAADKIRHRGAHRAFDAPSTTHPIYFTDENGDKFYIEAAAPKAP